MLFVRTLHEIVSLLVLTQSLASHCGPFFFTSVVCWWLISIWRNVLYALLGEFFRLRYFSPKLTALFDVFVGQYLRFFALKIFQHTWGGWRWLMREWLRRLEKFTAGVGAGVGVFCWIGKSGGITTVNCCSISAGSSRIGLISARVFVNSTRSASIKRSSWSMVSTSSSLVAWTKGCLAQWCSFHDFNLLLVNWYPIRLEGPMIVRTLYF